MQYPVQLLLLTVHGVLAKPDQSTAPATLPKAIIPYTPSAFGASADLVRLQTLDHSGAGNSILASFLTTMHFAAGDQPKMIATIGGATALPTGFTRAVYEGPPTESKAVFSSCKYIPVDKNTQKGVVAGVDVVPICECSGFVYDPTGFSVAMEPKMLVYLEPATCLSGVTCNGTSAHDGKSGCGTPAQFGVKSGKTGGHDAGDKSGAAGLQLHPFALPLTVFGMTFLGLAVAHI